MEIKEQNDRKRKQKWAAIGIPVNCLSCKDTTYQKKIPYSYDNEGTTSVYAALEQKEALQIKKTIGPYRSYELDTLRKLSRSGQHVGKEGVNIRVFCSSKIQPKFIRNKPDKRQFVIRKSIAVE